MLLLADAKKNELIVDKDIMVLANPEIAELPNWVIALVAAGALAAAFVYRSRFIISNLCSCFS